MVKLSALALIMSTVALACGVYVAVEVSRIRDELGRTRHPRERVVVADAPSDATAARQRAERRATAADRDEAAYEPAPPAAEAPAARGEPPATLEQRVAQLEKDQERLRAATHHAPLVPYRGHRFARSVDDLARSLKLTPTQKARVEQAVERGKRQIEEILKIPDETGKSPFERRQERRRKMLEAVKNKDTGNLIAFAGNMLAYRQQPIPGRNATYGSEIDRVKKETRDEIASSLSVEQQEAFRETNLDPMLGGGGAMAVSLFQSAGDSGDGDPEEGAVIAESIEIAIEDDGKAGNEKDPKAPEAKDE